MGTVSLKFYLNHLKSKGAKEPIYLRLTMARKKAELYTGFSIENKEWDDARQRTKRNVVINEELSGIESRVYETIRQLEKDNRTPTANLIKNFLLNKDKFDFQLIEFYDSYLTRLEKAGEVEEVTIRMYRNTRNHLLNFIRQAKLTNDIPLNHVDFRFISDFDLYLVNHRSSDLDKKLERNTITKHHSRFRTILIRALNEGYILKNPYKEFRLKSTPSKRTYLDEKELSDLIKHDLGKNESLDKVRDIFVFSVYTGLRFEDAQALTMDRLMWDNSGKAFLTIYQEKTQEPLSIPVLGPAISIINKYHNCPERKVQNRVLPSISNQKLNSYLKVIANLVGLNKHLTHHVARHTCATTVLLSNEVPIEVVSRWLGHTNIKTTQIYAKISTAYLKKVASGLENKI